LGIWGHEARASRGENPLTRASLTQETQHTQLNLRNTTPQNATERYTDATNATLTQHERNKHIRQMRQTKQCFACLRLQSPGAQSRVKSSLLIETTTFELRATTPPSAPISFSDNALRNPNKRLHNPDATHATLTKSDKFNYIFN
jgi:hypothetical protein